MAWMKWLAALVVGLGLALATWAFVVEPRQLYVRKVALVSQKWPADWPSLRIAVVGDFHVGTPQVDLDRVSYVVARVNAEKPDLVILLGDYLITEVLLGTFVPPEPIAERLAALEAPYGVYSVLGNHDWWYDFEATRRAIAGVGIQVLENQAAPVVLPWGTLWIGGVSDDKAGRPDMAATLAAVPDGAPVVVAMHDPASFADVPDRAIASLAGHTHGGQVRLPFLGITQNASRAPLRWSYGLIHEDGRDLYVTGGIGMSILPIRFGAPPEFAILTVSHGG